MPTKQEVFTKVATHLLTQQKRSMNHTNQCQYRTTAGLKCAVGCLIPDDEYTNDIEGYSAVELNTTSTAHKLVENMPVFKEVLSEHIKLLRCMQHIHDDAHTSKWKDELSLYASEHELIMPQV